MLLVKNIEKYNIFNVYMFVNKIFILLDYIFLIYFWIVLKQ